MGHFQVGLNRGLVHSRSDENEFNLHAKGWAPRLPLGKRQKVILKWPVGSSLTKFLFSCFLRQHCRISIISLSLLFWTNFPTTYDFLPTFWEILLFFGHLSSIRNSIQTAVTNMTIKGQIDGVAKGFPLGPVLANIFVCHFEEKRFLNNNACPSIRFRYVDDTFTLFDSKT